MLKVSNASNNPAKGNKVADVCYLTDKHSDAIYKVRVRACEACGLLAGFFFESIVGPEIVLFRNGLLPKIFLKRVRTTAATQSADCTGLAKLPETNRQPAQALQNCRNLNGDLHEVCTTARAQSAAGTSSAKLPKPKRQPANVSQLCEPFLGHCRNVLHGCETQLGHLRQSFKYAIY